MIRSLRDLWLIWLVLAVLTTLPYVVAQLRVPSGGVFTGVLSAYDDTFTYYAWMRQGAEGCWSMCDLFTSESHPCQFFLPLWSLLGAASGITGASIPLMFHIARLLAALILLIVARGAARTVMKSRTRLRYSMWMYAFSGGLGWVLVIARSGTLFGVREAAGSADLSLPEAIAFRSVFAQVHFALGIILLAGAILLYASAVAEGRTGRAAIAGLLVSALAVVHPYLIVVAGVTVFILSIARRWFVAGEITFVESYALTFRMLVVFGAATVPGLAYVSYLNRTSEVLREWLRVTDTRSPAPWEYVIGFGVVGALAVGGFVLILKRKARYGRMLMVWAVVQSLLLYAPVDFQRRLVEGLQLPIVIAASVAVFAGVGIVFRHHSRARVRKWILAGVVVIASLTNLGFITGQVLGLGPAAGDPRRYLRSDLVEALSWVKRDAAPDAILFSSYFTGNVAPSITGLRVYLGHYGQTINSDQKGERVDALYRNHLSEDAARELLVGHHVSYVIYGPFERAISGEFDPPSCLSLVQRVGGVEVFKVETP